jgi:preprotein translocase subunit SecE
MREGEVADKNRGRSVGDDDDDRRDEDVDDELDAVDDDEGDDLDESDDDADDEELADADGEKADGSRGKRATTKTKAKAGAVARSKGKDEKSVGIFGRLANFVREVIAELQKVIWPTRKELLTYTTVVVVFVAIMMSFVAGLDVGFAKLMFLVFGGNTSN